MTTGIVTEEQTHQQPGERHLTHGRRAIRDAVGLYPASEKGKVAVDGSVLDSTRGDHAVASAW